MKIPDLKETLGLTLKTIARFPLATACGIAGMLALCYLVGIPYHEEALKPQLVRLVLVSILGISFFTALQLFSEGLHAMWARYAAHAAGLSLLVFYYFALPDAISEVQIIRYVLFLITAHLLVSFAPHILHFEKEGFWSYNKQLFLQILIAFFYALVLYGGLALAIAAVQNLFDVDVHERIYARLFFVVMGIFSMLYFLGGIPRREETYQADHSYPTGLSVFAQYILIPLVGIYNIILYLYTIKIIIAWDWPRGWIAYLFVSYAVLGILSYLLIHPLATSGPKAWIRLFSKWFFISLVPLVGVLFLAVYRRVSEYGITENRYYLYLLDFWLLGIALYFLFSKTRNIKLIPITLAVIILLSSFGPWGAFSLSVNNQVSRFEKVMESKVKGSDELTFQDKKALSSILTYLERREQLDEVGRYFTYDIDSLLAQKHANIPAILLNEYNINYISEWQTNESGVRNFLSFSSRREYYASIKEFDEFVRYQSYYQQEHTMGTLTVNWDKDKSVLSIKDSAGWGAAIDFDSLINKLVKLQTENVHDMDPKELSLKGSTDQMEYLLHIQSLTLERAGEQYDIRSMEFDLFFNKKRQKI
ncbi:hypothetical protein C900_03874 [Fulvivirga imtechensis AK7]|uniref:DUF4153 domain-containing protein n=1 Tax=Fulvivirga imtechensis AK7 TaxID=1237149 RepID=L8JRT3_9BACT|nr:DUF4153 domain-containing protein [Fulvivirga imtechensis]ELR70189.1 hypothetical protein C900_03874 [Fulvivirga imtechensis AK7]